MWLISEVWQYICIFYPFLILLCNIGNLWIIISHIRVKTTNIWTNIPHRSLWHYYIIHTSLADIIYKVITAYTTISSANQIQESSLIMRDRHQWLCAWNQLECCFQCTSPDGCSILIDSKPQMGITEAIKLLYWSTKLLSSGMTWHIYRLDSHGTNRI